MTEFNEVAQSVRRDLDGETRGVLQAVVAAAWPGLNVASLKPVAGRNNTTDFLHPESMQAVYSHTKHPEHTEMRYPYLGAKRKSPARVPPQFTYAVYGPQGHVASTIQGAYVRFAGNERVPYVTSIKDFDAPHTAEAQRQPQRDPKIISRNRREAREDKHLRNRLLDAELSQKESDTQRQDWWHSGFVLCSRMSRAAIITPRRALPTADAELSVSPGTINGPARRERTFSAIEEDISYTRTAWPQPGLYALDSRRIKDRTNHPGGDYTVVQYASGGKNYAIARYRGDGQRISLHSVAGGRVVKELGADHRTAVAPSRKNAHPPGRSARTKLVAAAMERDASIDLQPEMPLKVRQAPGLRYLKWAIA